MPVLSQEQKKAKIATICSVEGQSEEYLIAKAALDSVCVAICGHEHCDNIEEMEPDQDQGYCSECHTQTMVSLLILADIV